jgi:hypothetical protein
VTAVSIYVDFKLDESYTPARISVRAGTAGQDLTVDHICHCHPTTVQFPIIVIGPIISHISLTQGHLMNRKC